MSGPLDPLGRPRGRPRGRLVALVAAVTAAVTGLVIGLATPASAQAADPNAGNTGNTGDAAAPTAPVTPAEEAPKAVPSSTELSQVQVGSAGAGVGIALSADRRSVLHVGVDAGAGFDTNPYSVPFSEAAKQFSGDVSARIRPSIHVDSEGSLLAFRGGLVVDYGFLPGLILQNSRNFLLYRADASADLEVGRGGGFSFAVGDGLSWDSDPGNVTIGTTFNRINNQLRAGLGFKPGGGALSFRLGTTFDISQYIDIDQIFEDPNDQVRTPVEEGVLNTMMFGAQLRTDYKFLPKTGAFLVLGGGWSFYPYTGAPFNGDNPNADASPMSFPVTATIGIQGQILNKLAGLASIGYANPLTFDTLPDGNTGITTATLIGVTGQAELQWMPTPATRIAGGFQRTFRPAPLYQYLGNNRFYAAANQTLAGRFNLGVTGGYSIVEFGEEQQFNGLPFTDAQQGRLDGHLDLNAQLSYYFTDWMSVGVANRLNWRVTNADDVTLVGQDPVNLSYLRNETFVLASVQY